jgi:hypothetical protein
MAMICSKLGTWLLLPVLSAPMLMNAQSPLVGSDSAGVLRMFPSDRAILEVQDPRQDLPCTVNPVKPALGFDLRFHAGYEVGIPLKQLAGPENQLTMIFRVTPEAHKDQPAYFVQRMRVPSIEADASGTAYLEGFFDLGEGRYHVDWMMRDRSEHLCSSYWDAEAALAPKDKQLTLPIQPGAVQAAEEEAFKEEPPVQRTQDEPPLKVKVLVNFAPLNAHGAILQPLDRSALVSILRTIAREPRIGRFSVVAFNLEEQRILYRQQDSARIDFPALGEALQSLNLGTVDLGRLSRKNGETEFLANLIQREIGGADHPDALIFAGPKALLEESVPTESLKEVGEVQYPVFYMNYNLHPESAPWRDAIGRAVRFFKGYEYSISRPRDLWAAVGEIVSKSVKLKNVRRMAAASGSE